MDEIFQIYYNEIKEIPLLTAEEEYQLGIRILNGEKEAQNELVQHNLFLVIRIAKKYTKFGLSFSDLIQEGNIGLINAAKNFDISKECRFSTIATIYIRSAITRAIANKARSVKLPVYLHDKLVPFKKWLEQFQQTFNRNPTIEEIAQQLQVKISVAQAFYDNMKEVLSLNSLIKDHTTELEELIGVQENIEESIIKQQMIEEVHELLKKVSLNKRQRDILYHRFGLFCEVQTLLQLSEKYHITKERVRQIEKGCLQKLRNRDDIKDFAFYMDDPIQALENIKK